MKRLLIDDDDLDICGFIQTASDSKQFVTVCNPDAFDMAFIDLVMPGTNGTEVLQAAG